MATAGPDSTRWRALLALAAGVLVVHLMLLTDGWPTHHLSEPETGGAAIAGATAQPPGPAEAAPRMATPVVPMTTSTVRWIAPRPTVAPRPPAVAALRRTPARPAPPPVADTAAATAPPVLADAPAENASPPSPDTPPPASEPPTVVEAPQETAPPPALQDTLLAAAAPAPPGADGGSSLPPALPPASVDLPYDIHASAKGMRYSADARLKWQQGEGRYRAEMEISAFLVGSRVQTSEGRMGPQGLLPERFGDRRRSSEKAAHFDRVEQRIRYSSNAKDSPLLPGAQDRLSVFLQLGALLQARPEAYPQGQTVELQVVSTGSAEVWQFEVGPLEALALPAGAVNARRLTRAPRREYDSRVEVWLAPAWQHLPVRIRITEHNGDQADQQLRELPRLAPSDPLVQ